MTTRGVSANVESTRRNVIRSISSGFAPDEMVLRLLQEQAKSSCIDAQRLKRQKRATSSPGQGNDGHPLMRCSNDHGLLTFRFTTLSRDDSSALVMLSGRVGVGQFIEVLTR